MGTDTALQIFGALLAMWPDSPKTPTWSPESAGGGTWVGGQLVAKQCQRKQAANEDGGLKEKRIRARRKLLLYPRFAIFRTTLAGNVFVPQRVTSRELPSCRQPGGHWQQHVRCGLPFADG